MLAVLQGLSTIGIVVGVGYLLARTGLLPESTPVVLSRLVFFVATPALLLETLAAASISAVLSAALAVTALTTTVAWVSFVLIARVWWKRDTGSVVIGSLASSYVNAGNLGIPLAVYVFDNATYVAPVMLYQLVVLAPIAFVVLDMVESGRRPSWRRVLVQPVRNPVIVGSVIGISLAATGASIPDVINAPLELISDMAVPGALIAFGISLRGAPLPGRGGRAADLTVATVLKLIVMPVVAYSLGRWVFGMNGEPLVAATMCAALPTAQNVFVYAVRYKAAVPLARDAVATTTLLCIPVLVVIAGLLT
ncbi:MAG TPA: AEC family transporter [Nakamurella sp.]